ncbi:MAG TPA: carboxymuconolactone decarboxylase family protein [Microbacteriaceae bacterium]|nr:carboxymuconolactone decarboxylase family protein [Microbacteriaceae bacterium]
MTDPAVLKGLIEDRFGGWNAIWEGELRERPEYLEAIARLHAAPERISALTPRIRALIRLALDAAVSHLNADGMERGIREALDAGASVQEVFETLMVSATIGVHGMNADVLAEVLAERGHPAMSAPLTPAQVGIRDEYTRVRGYWRDFLDDTLRLAPDFLESYLAFSGAPWRLGVLEPKVRELIYIAFDTSPTHMHLTGLRLHINQALDHGAAPEEIVEVMALAGSMGLQSLEVGVPILSRLA